MCVCAVSLGKAKAKAPSPLHKQQREMGTRRPADAIPFALKNNPSFLLFTSL